MNTKNFDLESMAATLESSGQYRVLRKLTHFVNKKPANPSDVRTGLFLDVETTGLDFVKDEIIELAMVPFTYGRDGSIFEVKAPFQKFQQPSTPITPEITALTGITNEMVAGQKIDAVEVEEFMKDAALVVAHNAAFDRRFAERLSPAFAAKPWACSMTQIDWAAEGFEGLKLAYLVMEAGFFYEKHRATSDCLAAIQLLAMSLPKTRSGAMKQLLEQARGTSWRIWAENSPFDLKDILKARGYRWNGEGSPRAWYIDVPESERENELSFLRAEIYKREVNPLVKKITAYERFSIRA